MKSKKRRNFYGAFDAANLGHDLWCLTQREPSDIQVFLRGMDAWTAESLGASPLHDLGIEWNAGSALLTWQQAGSVKSVQAMSAIVHEPLGALYAGLPLVEFDAKARRFWRRVFVLVRIPGGRYLLGLVARSARRPP